MIHSMKTLDVVNWTNCLPLNADSLNATSGENELAALAHRTMRHISMLSAHTTGATDKLALLSHRCCTNGRRPAHRRLQQTVLQRVLASNTRGDLAVLRTYARSHCAKAPTDTSRPRVYPDGGKAAFGLPDSDAFSQAAASQSIWPVEPAVNTGQDNQLMRILSYKSAIVKLQFDGPSTKKRRFRDPLGELRAVLDLPGLSVPNRDVARRLESRHGESLDRRPEVGSCAWHDRAGRLVTLDASRPPLRQR